MDCDGAGFRTEVKQVRYKAMRHRERERERIIPTEHSSGIKTELTSSDQLGGGGIFPGEHRVLLLSAGFKPHKL